MNYCSNLVLKTCFGELFEEYTLISRVSYVERVEKKKFLKLLSAVLLPSCNIGDLASLVNNRKNLDQDRFSQRAIRWDRKKLVMKVKGWEKKYKTTENKRWWKGRFVSRKRSYLRNREIIKMIILFMFGLNKIMSAKSV